MKAGSEEGAGLCLCASGLNKEVIQV